TARTSPWCWGPVALRGEAKTSPCHLFHLLGFVCLLSIPRLLLTGPGATWCRLGSEERDFVTMSACNVLYRLSIFIFRFAVCHLSPAFCSPVPGKPGADWEVKRGTSSPCLLCNVLCHLSCHMFGHLSPSVGSHLIVVLGSSSPSGEERDVVTMSALQCLLPFHLSCHMFGHLSPSVGSHLIVVLGSSNPSG
ncbi:hypothetical protein N7489_002928, partial [Penicillium chrysogenum]|uniref:uncharacterized protein n=1 Tax=Penicillium chrysogenum TaxID=5076 RepID=UPI0024DF0F84